jgi:actin-related protein
VTVKCLNSFVGHCWGLKVNLVSVEHITFALFYVAQYRVLFVILSQPKPIDVQVISHHMQRYAVWFGGSMLASTVR